jgi:hypothetical protein
VIFPTFTTALEEEWKYRYAGFHTSLKTLSVNELSFTISGELADSVHVTPVPVATIAHSRTARDGLVPKNSSPGGVVNDDTTPVMSVGRTDPKTAASNVGMVLKDCPKRVSFDGGVTEEDST